MNEWKRKKQDLYRIYGMFTCLYKYNDPNKYRSRGETAQERLQKCKDIEEEEPTWEKKKRSVA